VLGGIFQNEKEEGTRWKLLNVGVVHSKHQRNKFSIKCLMEKSDGKKMCWRSSQKWRV
jgi:hypothetical protein